MSDPTDARPRVALAEVAREWARIGVTGFGGPPAHIRLLRDLCVDRRGWIPAPDFEHAIATCNLLPGPASTQLAIYCAWRLRGWRGALVGGLGFIVPGLVTIIALAAVFLAPELPTWLAGAAAGGGAAVAAVAVHAGWGLTPSSWARRSSTWRWVGYVVAGTVASALVGAWVVLVLLGCGAVELVVRTAARRDPSTPRSPALLLLPIATGGISLGVLGALAWMAFKVGALSYGGGFVIIPLMQGDAVDRYGWMTPAEFLSAVALGQVTPGPVTQTVAVVGYAAAGLLGAAVASLVAFGPSFVLVLAGARHFEALRHDPRATAFLDGAGPAAIGAILGAAVPLALALTQGWQGALLAAAAVSLFLLRRSVVLTLVVAAALGAVLVALGAVAL